LPLQIFKNVPCCGQKIADELETLKEIGAVWLEAKKERLEYAIKEGILREVSYEDRKK
jgi:hypothetical protein